MEPEEASSDLQQRSSSQKLKHRNGSKTEGQTDKLREKSCKKCLSVTSVTWFLSIKVSSASHQSVSPLIDQSCWNLTTHTHTAEGWECLSVCLSQSADPGIRFRIVLLKFYRGLSEHLPTELNSPGAVTVKVRPKPSNTSRNTAKLRTHLSLLLIW